jgi:addiction module HigA family antidote
MFEEHKMSKRELEPIHPGEILLEEFLNPMDITQYRLAKDISVDPRRINEIVHGKRGISADTAIRLGHFFGMSPQFWLNLQSHYDLELLDMQSGDQIQNEVKVLA